MRQVTGQRALQAFATLLAISLSSIAAAQDGSPPDPVVEIRGLTEGVWIHTSFRTLDDGSRFPSHGLVVREGDSLTLIDTAWGEEETELLLDAVAFQVGLPVTRAVVTHFHGDRASGSDLLEAEGVEVWAHPLTLELASERGYPVPDRAFEGLDEPGSVVDFGTLQVFYPGPAHSSDNIMVWLPDQQTLFGGCPIRGANDSDLGNVRDGDVQQWAAAMQRTEMLYGGARLVVSSHADPAGPELIGHTAQIARRTADAERANAP
jgi:metallo-beta-lactamase class B VIM